MGGRLDLSDRLHEGVTDDNSDISTRVTVGPVGKLPVVLGRQLQGCAFSVDLAGQWQPNQFWTWNRTLVLVLGKTGPSNLEHSDSAGDIRKGDVDSLLETTTDSTVQGLQCERG